MRRLAVVALALLLASAGPLVHPTPVAASWSADLSITLSGDGNGHVTSDDGAIDCWYGGGVKSGDCSEHYILPDFVPDYPVVVTFTPAADSIACAESCASGAA